jgi:hypothetical protein
LTYEIEVGRLTLSDRNRVEDDEAAIERDGFEFDTEA